MQYAGFRSPTQQVSGIAVRHQGQEGGGFGMRFGLTRRWVNTDEGVTGTVRDEDGEVLHESGTRGPGGYFTWEFSSVGFFPPQNPAQTVLGDKPKRVPEKDECVGIWNKVTGAVVFDTQFGASDSADPTTPLGDGSSIIISK